MDWLLWEKYSDRLGRTLLIWCDDAWPSNSKYFCETLLLNLIAIFNLWFLYFGNHIACLFLRRCIVEMFFPRCVVIKFRSKIKRSWTVWWEWSSHEWWHKRDSFRVGWRSMDSSSVLSAHLSRWIIGWHRERERGNGLLYTKDRMIEFTTFFLFHSTCQSDNYRDVA